MAKTKTAPQNNTALWVIVALLIAGAIAFLVWKYVDFGTGDGEGGAGGGGAGGGGTINNKLGKFMGADGQYITDPETIKFLTEKFKGVRGNLD